MQKTKVMVAMSGGTDSSAVCRMLQEQGHEVVGLTMRVFDLPRQFPAATLAGLDETVLQSGSLPGEPDFLLAARRLAERLQIRHITVDVREGFRRDVVTYFLQEYLAGRTPNPCVHCNRRFKFRLLEEWANREGCELMATGHYVRTETDAAGRTFLLRGIDPTKDQSYFLWRLPSSLLSRCLFPLGGMKKTEVRAWLRERDMTTEASRKDSMETCFVEGDYRDFLLHHCPEAAQRAGGQFVSREGKKLGTHRGVPFFTVGQRKGLGIALGKPAYVVRLNAEKNTVVLGDADDLLAPAFFVKDSVCADPSLILSNPNLTVRIRYHSEPIACSVETLPDGRWLVRPKTAVSAVTPGQSAVFYEKERLLGGAVIDDPRGIGLYL